MNIINEAKFYLFKNNIKINKKLYFKNIKLLFEKKFKNIFFKWVVICHALTGSHHFHGVYKNNINNIGWWDKIINEKLLSKYKINYICINNIISNWGSTNTLSINPLNNKIYKNSFPKIKIEHLIKIQKSILYKLKIRKIFLILGGSLGGIQSIIWSIIYPNITKNFLCIAGTNKMSLYNIIKNKINKLIINYTQNVTNNKYFNYNIKTIKNIKLIRMIDHLSYLSNWDIKNKIFKKIFYKNYNFSKKKYKISKYFYYKTNNFYKKNNIISYLYILNIINKININSYKNIKIKFINCFIIIFKNDKRFLIKNSRLLINFLIKKKYNLNYKVLKVKSGHDGFLKENIFYKNLIYYYIKYISEW